MNKMIHMIETTWKGRRVVVEDKRGTSAAGVVKHIAWNIPADYYSSDDKMPLVQVELTPMKDEDAAAYGVNDKGLIVKCFDPMTITFKLIDENGNYINAQDYDTTL